VIRRGSPRASDQLFHHTDRNTLHKIADPTPNWLMRGDG